MAEADNKNVVIDQFAAKVEVQTADLGKYLAVPVPTLQGGLDKINTLVANVPRLNQGSYDTQAAGMLRFPNLHGTAQLFADGLSKNPDIVAEALFGADVLMGAADLDLSLGRFVFVTEQIWHGGETGEVVAGAAQQKIAIDTTDRASAAVKDLNRPVSERSDIAIAMEESFRILAEQRQKQQAAQATTDKNKQPYIDQIQQAQSDADLAKLVDSFMTSVQ